ncbi:acetate/propionate family kinase [Tundrisphaera sp. TA3]|uniref:acetate/propionate family kinase n=1 Tax=Tundrisphaera sp. TA3 TaxID=3435775 RepID=UPI003EB9B357
MKILVANLGSTSFKYRLYDLSEAGENLLARGAIERIGSDNAKVSTQSGRGKSEQVRPIKDHGDAVQICLDQLVDPSAGVLADTSEVAAIGFKAVLAKDVSGVQLVTPAVLDAMDAFADVAPAHNPPYTAAMRMLGERFPTIPLVAAFETGFHQTIPDGNRRYAIPDDWTNRLGIRRWGFHGNSHTYISRRMVELVGRDGLKVISCHLGGSSSICAIRDGKSVATSMGMSPQSGLPQNNRVGDLDVFALPAIMRATGLTLERVLDTLANQSGFQGMGGVGNDLRDIEAAAAAGNDRAKQALDVYISSARHYLGAYLVELGGADAIAFTGGIGENSSLVREGICRDLGWFGIKLDPAANASGPDERIVSTPDSRVEVWTVPTNEEIVVARHVRDLLSSGQNA